MSGLFVQVAGFTRVRFFQVLIACLFSAAVTAQESGNRGGGRVNPNHSGSWSAEEYSGLRGTQEIRTALASKAFTWITGSPADNEKLAIGKNAQFFGFVALRYQSGRAANRGLLGRAMFSIASADQRAAMVRAVRDEIAPLNEWWSVREEILTLLENHLYTDTPVDVAGLAALGEQFAMLNSEVAIHEAKAYAAFEDMMTDEQLALITQWRSDPEAAGAHGRDVRVQDRRVDRDQWKLLEDLYAKCFSWISGTAEDNEVIPIGQPAQFFGFVSIRHKSGHAANRGDIARKFYSMLSAEQQSIIDSAVEMLIPEVRSFLATRHLYLNLLAGLRTEPADFDIAESNQLAREMGVLEMQIAKIEAQAYRHIRSSMSEEQLRSAMDMRNAYIIDESQIAMLSFAERGETLSVLCAGCHGGPGSWRAGMPGPSLDGFWNRPIASAAGFEFSDALRSVAEEQGARWTPELLDEFLASPRSFAPGTKMEFQGFLNPDDRRAIIDYFERMR